MVFISSDKFPRKKKKSIIKVFGRGTYRGIIEGILRIEPTKLYGQRGTIIRYTKKPIGKNFYNEGQTTIHNNIINLS
jgi:hypothetical protein